MQNHTRTEGLLAEPGIQLLLAWFGTMLLGWPVIQIAGEQGHWLLFLYVFTVWAVLVVLLVFVGREITRSDRTHEAAPGPDPR